jgi:hypothetical protein
MLQVGNYRVVTDYLLSCEEAEEGFMQNTMLTPSNSQVFSCGSSGWNYTSVKVCWPGICG